jgi:hypothetical protein
MKTTDAMPFKAFWFEEDGVLVHLPHWISREMVVYPSNPELFAGERENRIIQFLLNSGHIWTFSAKLQERVTELIKAGRVQFYTDAHMN